LRFQFQFHYSLLKKEKSLTFGVMLQKRILQKRMKKRSSHVKRVAIIQSWIQTPPVQIVGLYSRMMVTMTGPPEAPPQGVNTQAHLQAHVGVHHQVPEEVALADLLEVAPAAVQAEAHLVGVPQVEVHHQAEAVALVVHPQSEVPADPRLEVAQRRADHPVDQRKAAHPVDQRKADHPVDQRKADHLVGQSAAHLDDYIIRDAPIIVANPSRITPTTWSTTFPF
jgi:hypothetical protein